LGGTKTEKNDKPAFDGIRNRGMVDLPPTTYPIVASQVRPMRQCIYCGGSYSLCSVRTRRNATEKRGMCARKKRVKYGLMTGLLCVLIIVNT
jgi:hypothetical protein